VEPGLEAVDLLVELPETGGGPDSVPGIAPAGILGFGRLEERVEMKKQLRRHLRSVNNSTLLPLIRAGV
jgi:hypothetical protein